MAYVYVHVFCIHHIHLYIELPSKIYLLFCYAIARGKKGFEGCYLHNKHYAKRDLKVVIFFLETRALYSY